MKVKIIEADSSNKLEDKVNDFICGGTDVVDIKFQAYSLGSIGVLTQLLAMIILE